MISYNIYSKVLGLAVAVMAFGACTDTWNDHYESTGSGEGEAVLHEGTLWQAIKADPELSNFAQVIAGCGFDKTLNSSQA